MASETFSVKVTAKTAATKALGIMKKARLSGLKLRESRIIDQGDGFEASARWEEGGFFGSSAEVRVETRARWHNPTEVTITVSSDKCDALARRLRKDL